MALTRGFIRNAVTTPLDARLVDMAKVVSNLDGSPRPGVLGVLNGPLLAPSSSAMSVAVAAAPFVTTKGKADGVAIFTNDGTVNVTIAAAPVANSRIDVIWVKHNDDTTGDTDSKPVFGVTAGAAAAFPTKPAIPTGALELGTLRVYAGTTAANGAPNTLTHTYQMTAMQGGIVTFRTKADLDLWINPTDGQLAFVLDDIGPNPLYMRSTGVWGRLSTYLGGASKIAGPTASIGATEVPIPGTSVTVTVPRAGKIRLSGGLASYGTSANNIIVIRIKEGATVVREFTRQANSSPVDASTTCHQEFSSVVDVTAGTHTYQIACVRAAGSGTIAVNPSDASPAELHVDLVG